MQLTRKEYRLLRKLDRKGSKIESFSQVSEDELARLRLLESAGYVVLSEAHKFIAGVTVEGRHAMEIYKDYVVDRRWTRGLAIVAIIVSIIAISPLSEAVADWLSKAGQSLLRLLP